MVIGTITGLSNQVTVDLTNSDEEVEVEEEEYRGWAYVGSANFTSEFLQEIWLLLWLNAVLASAWGTISGSAFNPVLNVRADVLRSFVYLVYRVSSQVTNYELGVVIPLKSKQEADNVACFQRPPSKYQSSDLPWVSAHDLGVHSAIELNRGYL